MNGLLRIGLVGAGNAALSGHLPAWLEPTGLGRRVAVVAVADPSSQNREAMVARIAGVRVHAGAAEMLAAGGIDVVDVCAPPDDRVTHIGAAVEAGCHIVCEKPLARTLAEGLAIGRLLAGRRQRFMPCHQYRYSPLWQAVGEVVRGGALGDVHLVRFDVLRPRADTGSAHWQSGWRRDPVVAGGGIVHDIGIHYFYLIRTLFGRPETVSARVARLSHRKDEVEDTALVVLEYPTMLVQLNLSWAADRRENGLRLVGTKGRLDLHGERLVLESGGGERTWDLSGQLQKSAYAGWYAALFTAFVDDIASGSGGDAWLEEALDTLRLATLTYRAGSGGRVLAFADLEG